MNLPRPEQISCETAITLFPGYAERSLLLSATLIPSDLALQAHLNTCTGCAEVWSLFLEAVNDEGDKPSTYPQPDLSGLNQS